MTNEPQSWAQSQPTTPARPQQQVPQQQVPQQLPPQQYVAAPPVPAPSAAYVDPDAQVVQETTAGSPALRIFQVLTGAVGAVLFVLGLIAVFRVDFGAGMFETSGAVADFGFSPTLAIAAILLGGATMVAAFAAQDRGTAAFVGLLTVAVGVAALILEGEIPETVGVDRRSALLFVVLGAAIFVLSLIPWWSGRRRTTQVRAAR